MQIEIKNRWTGAVIHACEVPVEIAISLAMRYAVLDGISKRAKLSGADLSGADLSGADLSGADLSGADLSGADLSCANLSRANLSGADLSGVYLSGADLSGADLSGADLSRANLSRANLSGANLSGADLSRADLSGADLSGVYLSGADLSRANLSRANLSRANLSGADLSGAKNDFWSILLRAKKEILALRSALVAGTVDGSTYEGHCACLVGTIANAAHKYYKELDNDLKPDSSRPAEHWFIGIKKGDTPDTNPISKITVDWLDEFVMLMEKN